MLLGIAGAVVVGGGALVAVGEISRLRMALGATQQMIARLTTQTDELQRQLDAVQGERTQLEARVAQMRDALETSTEELTRLRNASTEARLRADELGNEQDALARQVARLTRERDEAVEQVKQFETQKGELERSVARFRERWKFLDRDYQQLAERLKQVEQEQAAQAAPRGMVVAAPGQYGLVASTGESMTPHSAASSSALAPPIGRVPEMSGSEGALPFSVLSPQGMGGAIELPPIVVQRGQAWSGLGVRARVMEVNAQHHFVVLDKGAEDGIRVGTTFAIVRGGSPVGTAVAVRVRPRLAACDVMPSRSPEPLQVGDVAVPQSS